MLGTCSEMLPMGLLNGKGISLLTCLSLWQMNDVIKTVSMGFQKTSKIYVTKKYPDWKTFAASNLDIFYYPFQKIEMPI